ncbi:MAG: hypothetical protein WA172_17680 [Terriglobales bacterium]
MTPPRISRIANVFVLAGLFVLTIGFSGASDFSHFSGSYQVLRTTGLGSQTRLRLQLHLSNRGQRDLQILRITFWDPPHHPGRSPQACSLLVRRGSSATTTQEFTMTRSEYRFWNSAKRLNLLVAVEGPGGRKATELVRLDRISGGKAN